VAHKFSICSNAKSYKGHDLISNNSYSRLIDIYARKYYCVVHNFFSDSPFNMERATCFSCGEYNSVDIVVVFIPPIISLSLSGRRTGSSAAASGCRLKEQGYIPVMRQRDQYLQKQLHPAD
jgi:hypothetical protein